MESQLSPLFEVLESFSKAKNLRDTYIKIVQSRKEHELFITSKESGSRIEDTYRYANNLAYRICRQLLELNEEPEPINLQIMCEDLKRVPIPIALVAWLTTDHFRWEQIYPAYAEEYPDLSYGLVTQFPLCVMTYAVFCLGFRFIYMPIEYYLDAPEEEFLIDFCAHLARDMFFSLPKEVQEFCWQATKD